MTVAETALAGLLRIADLSAAQLSAVLELGDEMRSGPGWWTGTHADGSVTCLLDEPSPWAGASFQDAAQRLGMVAVTLRPDELHRSPADSTAIVVATAAHAALEALARSARSRSSTPPRAPTIRARRSPTCSRCAATSVTWTGFGSPTWGRATTSRTR